MLLKHLEHSLQSPFCIYGAGIVATSVYTAIKTIYHKTPLFFLISDSADKEERSDVSPAEIDGIVVKGMSEWKQELAALVSTCKRQGEDNRLGVQKSADVLITYLIAVPEMHHMAIMETLHSTDFVKVSIKEPHIILVTNTLENALMGAYYSRRPKCATVSDLLSVARAWESKQTATWQNEVAASAMQIFQAKSHMDKPLRGQQSLSVNQSSVLPRYITPIQVGAALTNCRIVDLQDNQGDNISAKNRNYSELTATYYAWKHSRAVYKGICHYRRIFDISDEQMKRLLELEQEWDVILPYPSVYYPNIAREHVRYVNESDWNAMLQALQETAPEYLEAYEKGIADGERFFNNFNMLIAKAEVFDDYCNFLFTVLERTEELTMPKGSERADRFAGYLGENLTTLYILKNRERLKIAYAGKIWML